MFNGHRVFHSRARSADLSVSVEISDAVFERIKNTVSHSSIEEGGKLVGKVRKTARESVIRVESYIDSGPRVGNSASHLYPDGEYQEAMFRVVESFDPDIEHLGSWHSHHCNGLDELSSGDISGYLSNVNDARYNLDLFFVLLVTSARHGRLGARYYLFCRGRTDYFELPESDIQRFHGAGAIEPFLREAERATRQHRTGWNLQMNRQRTEITSEVGSRDELMRRIRSEDRQWLIDVYPSAKAMQDKRDGSLCWHWAVPSGRLILNVRYCYPTGMKGAKQGEARLDVVCAGRAPLSTGIPLNDARFDEIARRIREVQESVESDDPGPEKRDTVPPGETEDTPDADF